MAEFISNTVVPRGFETEKPEVVQQRNTFLPFALPDIDREEMREVQEVLESGWLTTGPKTRDFESQFAAFLGAKHAIAVNSCTAAMHLALEAIGLQPGDVVLTSPYTFAATAEVIRYFDAIPVFVDIERDTLNIDPAQLGTVVDDLRSWLSGGRMPGTASGARIVDWVGRGANGRTPVIRAVMPVHMAGHACDIDAIRRIADDAGLAVIDDAAHSFPARYYGRWIGGPATRSGHPQLSCFSFYATKTLTTGEGGMITTDNDELAERCRIMSLHGISKDAWKRYTSEGSWYYEIIAPGFKYNLTDVAAAIGLGQLRKTMDMWQKRRQIARIYNEAFAGCEELETPVVRPGIDHAWHLYVLRLCTNRFLQTPGIRIRDLFIEELKHARIGASVHFIPLHMHPYYRENFGYRPDDFPVAASEYQRAISLPIYSKMTEEDVRYVASTVTRLVRKYRL